MEQLLFIRFGVAVVACAIAYFALWTIIIKSGYGMYAETQVPWGPLDGPHKRARRAFYTAMCLVLLAVGLLGMAAFEWTSPSTWSCVGMPAVVGACFSMLYAWGTRSDRVRPRAA